MKKVLAFLISFLFLSSSVAAFDLFEDKIPPLVIDGSVIQGILLEPVVVHEGEPYYVEVFVADNREIERVSLFYKVNDSSWKEVQMEKKQGEILKDLLNNFKVLPNVYGLYKGQIPPQQAGSEVWYKIVAIDKAGNKFESIPRYYIVDKPSGKRVLIIDPSYPMWYGKTLIPWIQDLLRQIEENYPLNSPIKVKIQEILENVTIAKEYGEYIFPKHYWNVLARNYHIRIITKFDYQELSSFKPKVVILSNIWLNPWQISPEDQKKLIRYLRMHNGGLIVTHGTLYDQIIYQSPEKQIEIGVPKHVGNISTLFEGARLPQITSDQDICDIIMSNHETLATVLGFKLAPLVEHGKKVLADTIFKAPAPDPATLAVKQGVAITIGSTPLFPVYIPFSGKLHTREEHPILSNLPSTFEIEIPSAYKRIGKKGYTLFGWQFVLPSELIHRSREKWRNIKNESKEFLSKVSEYQERILGVSPLKFQENALGGELIDSTLKLQFGENNFTIEILGNKTSIPLPKEVLEKGRILKLIGELGLAKAIAISDDGRAGIIVKDEPYLQCGIRTVYFTFEVEAGIDENSHKLLENAVEWASNFEYRPILRRVIILANDIDWKLKGELLANSLQKAGFQVIHVYAREFEKYKNERLIIILGGPKAYDGVGEIVQEVLNEKEQKLIIEGKRRIFVKADIWRRPQLVIIIAGKNRQLTAEKVIEYLNSMDIDYYQLLQLLLTS